MKTKKFMAVTCAATLAGAGMSAVVTELTEKGVVDTRLIRSGDDVALAVVDTRHPVVAFSNVGRVETTPPGVVIIFR